MNSCFPIFLSPQLIEIPRIVKKKSSRFVLTLNRQGKKIKSARQCSPNGHQLNRWKILEVSVWSSHQSIAILLLNKAYLHCNYVFNVRGTTLSALLPSGV